MKKCGKLSRLAGPSQRKRWLIRIKPKSRRAANFNNRTLNALFSAVTNEKFKKISSTGIAKEAWTILQTTYKGTKAVKDSKLQRLTTSFEEIKIEEDESFDEFYAKLRDIVDSALILGKPFLNPRL